MIGNDKQLYIIDFNRNDFGYPWEEFNRIVWCAQATPLFATGMVNGYFDNDVPMKSVYGDAVAYMVATVRSARQRMI